MVLGLGVARESWIGRGQRCQMGVSGARADWRTFRDRNCWRNLPLPSGRQGNASRVVVAQLFGLRYWIPRERIRAGGNTRAGERVDG